MFNLKYLNPQKGDSVYILPGVKGNYMYIDTKDKPVGGINSVNTNYRSKKVGNESLARIPPLPMRYDIMIRG